MSRTLVVAINHHLTLFLRGGKQHRRRIDRTTEAATA